MRVSAFDYVLPQENIAQVPVARGTARLLKVRRGDAWEEGTVADLPAEIAEGSVVVLNDTRVFSARLLGEKIESGGRVEVLLLQREPSSSSQKDVWRAIGRASKGLRAGTRLRFRKGGHSLDATIVSEGDGGLVVALEVSREEAFDAIERVGHVPLPPYIERPDDASDRERYQTVFADVPGAVAAPTAGLHITEPMLAALRRRAEVVTVTLHVGLGTFQTVKVDDLDDHPMHAEWIKVPRDVVDAVTLARKQGRPIVAVGTTVVRALESAAGPEGVLSPFSGETRLLIQPGYRFQVVDRLFTNFHMPRSTLLALVCAFAGTTTLLGAYEEALRRKFRFLSYGDAMLLERAALV